MVTVSAPSPLPIAPKTHQDRNCPRCKARLIRTYYEPACIHCGFADYTYIPRTSITIKSPVNSAAEHVFRYIDDSPHLADTLVKARLQRMGNRVELLVTCPFCHLGMEQTSLSGKRRERREERFRCPIGHRISLIPNKNGDKGWK